MAYKIVSLTGQPQVFGSVTIPSGTGTTMSDTAAAALPAGTLASMTSAVYAYQLSITYIDDTSTVSHSTPLWPSINHEAKTGGALGNSAGFQQNGTGSALRTYQAKGQDILTSADFGMVGDSVTDDTVALQKAINAAAAQGKTLRILPGNYLLSAQSGTLYTPFTTAVIACVTIPSNSTIQFDPGVVFKASDYTPGYDFRGMFLATNVSNVIISGQALFDGLLASDESNASKRPKIGIVIYTCTNVKVQDIRFQNFAYHAIATYASSTGICTDVLYERLVSNNGAQSSLEVYSSLTNFNTQPHKRIVVKDCIGLNSKHYFGIEMRGVQDSRIEGGFYSGNAASGINIEENSSRVKVRGAVMDANAGGFVLSGNQVGCTEILVEDCVISNATATAVPLTAGGNVRFVRCKMLGGTGNGVSISTPTTLPVTDNLQLIDCEITGYVVGLLNRGTNTKLRHCTITGNSSVDVQVSGDGFQIENNTIGTWSYDTSARSTVGYGLNYDPTNNSSFNLIGRMNIDGTSRVRLVGENFSGTEYGSYDIVRDTSTKGHAELYGLNAGARTRLVSFLADGSILPYGAANVGTAGQVLVSGGTGQPAAWGGFTQAGTGAVARNFQDKERQSVSVFDFMTSAQIADVQSATPTLDISGAILNAILASSGKRLVFEPATAYNLDNLVVVYANQVTNCVIDFNGARILWRGNRKTDGSQGQEYDWNWGVFSFKGLMLPTVSTNLTAILPDGSNTITIPGHGLTVGDYAYLKITDPTAAGSTLLKFKLASRHCRVVGVSGNDVTFDFTTAFDIVSGSLVEVSKLNPMTGIHVMNLNLEDISTYPYGGATTDLQKWQGASGVVFDLANYCTGSFIKVKGIPKVSCESQACYRVSFTDCTLDTPKETVSGGYLCKFEDSLFNYARNLTADNERHVLDITASSSCMVEHSGSWKTANASFVTHGTYEHDCTYRGCWGYMSMAGSGTDFGQKTRRIKVERHIGTNLNISSTGQNVYDCTFTDCRFASVSYINIDGNTFDKCDFPALTYLQQNGALSLNKTLFRDTYLRQVQSPFIPAGMTNDITFNGGSVYCLSTADMLGTNNVVLNQSYYSSAGSPTLSGGTLTISGGLFELRSTSAIITCSLSKLSVTNKATVKAGFNYTGSTGAIEITLADSKFDMTGRTTSATFASVMTGGSIDFTATGCLFDWTASTNRHCTFITSGATLRIVNCGNTYKAGSLRIDTAPLTGGALVHTNNITVGSTLTLPTTTTNVVNANNIAL